MRVDTTSATGAPVHWQQASAVQLHVALQWQLRRRAAALRVAAWRLQRCCCGVALAVRGVLAGAASWRPAQKSSCRGTMNPLCSNIVGKDPAFACQPVACTWYQSPSSLVSVMVTASFWARRADNGPVHAGLAAHVQAHDADCARRGFTRGSTDAAGFSWAKAGMAAKLQQQDKHEAKRQAPEISAVKRRSMHI